MWMVASRRAGGLIELTRQSPPGIPHLDPIPAETTTHRFTFDISGGIKSGSAQN